MTITDISKYREDKNTIGERKFSDEKSYFSIKVTTNGYVFSLVMNRNLYDILT